MAGIENLHSLYIIIFVLLIMSLIYHLYLHGDVRVPDDANPPKEKNYSSYINSAHSGMVKAFVFGVVTSSPDAAISTAIQNAVIYGLLNPVIMYIGY